MRIKRHITFESARDAVSALVGFGVIIHELYSPGAPRAELLALAAGLIGLPAKFFTDRKLKIPGLDLVQSGASASGPSPEHPPEESP